MALYMGKKSGKTAWIKQNAKDLAIDIAIGVAILGLLVVAGTALWVATLDIPDLSSLEQRKVLQSTKIYDRTGEVLLYDFHQDVKRTNIPLSDVSHHIKNATIAIEDDQFYEHWGVDIRAILRAAVSNLRNGNLLGGQGGSTITQQVIKNSILEQDKLLARKVKEAILALRLEQTRSKEEILELYLNETPYGGTIYGIEEASQAFFNKSAQDISLPEAAYLAALPQAPTHLSPYGNNRDALEARKNRVLERMQLNGFISEEEYQSAREAEVEFQPQSVSNIKAPHFVMYVREKLVEQYGEEALTDQGLRVITSLDWELQQEAERIVAEKVAENKEKYDASNAGLVAIDPKTGDVLTMVGSRDYFDEEIDGNFNIALANRQPGSSIKPFVYAAAFNEGYLPSTILYDVRTQFGSECAPSNFGTEAPCYAPSNYNGEFKGPVSMRNALAQSLNIPAVKTLYLTGLSDTIKLASDMGISTLDDPDRLGLTLVLGGGEVKLLEHTSAYGVFANEGEKAEQRVILRVEDAQGNTILDNTPQTSRVLDENVARMVNDVLSDPTARYPLWQGYSGVSFPDREVALKSGSTNNLRDAWVMGYTPNIAVGTWVGNNDNAVMGGGLSGLLTTPLWRAFMDVALEKLPAESFTEPTYPTEDIKPILRGQVVDVNQIINDYANNPDENKELNMDAVTDNIHNILHYVIKDNPRGPYPENPQQDSQYNNWEYGVQEWKQRTLQNFAPVLEDIEPEELEEELSEAADLSEVIAE